MSRPLVSCEAPDPWTADGRDARGLSVPVRRLGAGLGPPPRARANRSVRGPFTREGRSRAVLRLREREGVATVCAAAPRLGCSRPGDRALWRRAGALQGELSDGPAEGADPIVDRIAR